MFRFMFFLASLALLLWFGRLWINQGIEVPKQTKERLSSLTSEISDEVKGLTKNVIDQVKKPTESEKEVTTTPEEKKTKLAGGEFKAQSGGKENEVKKQEVEVQQTDDLAQEKVPEIIIEEEELQTDFEPEIKEEHSVAKTDNRSANDRLARVDRLLRGIEKQKESLKSSDIPVRQNTDRAAYILGRVDNLINQ